MSKPSHDPSQGVPEAVPAQPEPNEGNHGWTRMDTDFTQGNEENEGAGLDGHEGRRQKGTKDRRAEFRRGLGTIVAVAVQARETETRREGAGLDRLS